MNCDELNSQLESYLDGELTLSDRRDVDAHLVECKSCTNKIEALRALQQQVRSANYQKVLAGLKNNIQQISYSIMLRKRRLLIFILKNSSIVWLFFSELY